MKFLVAALALSQVVSAQFDSPLQPAAVISNTCSQAVGMNLWDVDRALYVESKLTYPYPVTSGTEAEFITSYDIVCSSTYINALAASLKPAAANCTTQEEQTSLKGYESFLRAEQTRQCIKADGVYCDLKHFQISKAANKTFASSRRASFQSRWDTNRTDLCSPCLKKQSDIELAAFTEALKFIGNGNATEMEMTKKIATTLVDVCPAGTTVIPATMKFTGPGYSSSASRMVVMPGLALITALLFI